MECATVIEKTKKVLVFGQVTEVRYLLWPGPKDALGTVFCAHGAIRNHYDFVPLARALAARYRVLAIDFPGHGYSVWLEDKKTYHAHDIHLQSAGQVLLAETAGPLIYIGTSMGGVVGMQLAAIANSPIDFLVLNDISPEANAASKKQFLKFLATDLALPSEREARAFVDKYIKVSEALADGDREALFTVNMRHDSDGKWRLNFDPGIKDAYRNGLGQDHETYWNLWEKVSCPVLLMRSSEGSFVDPSVVERMSAMHNELTVVNVPGTTHPPDLANAFQIDAIANWIEQRLPKPLAA